VQQADPAQRVSAPSIGLLIGGGVSAIGSVIGILLMVFASTLVFADAEARDALFGVGMWLFIAVVRLVLDGVTIYGALQMRQLRSWNLSLVGAISAMIPCSFCCLVSLPLGVWAIIVLMRDDVKPYFADRGPSDPYGDPPA